VQLKSHSARLRYSCNFNNLSFSLFLLRGVAEKVDERFCQVLRINIQECITSNCFTKSKPRGSYAGGSNKDKEKSQA